MRLVIAAALGLVLCATRPAVAGDYVLKLEMITDAESKVGDGKPGKTTDVRTLELSITPERRFQAKTTWENQDLTVKGKMREETDGKFRLDIRCDHAVKMAAFEETADANSAPDNERRSRVNTTVVVKPGDPLVIAGLISNQTRKTPEGDRHEARMMTLRVTVVEDNDDES